MANNTLIGALRAEATLESGKFVDGAKKIRKETKATEVQVQKSFGGMSASIKGFGTALTAGLSIGLLGGLIKKTFDYATSIKDVAAQVGVTTKELQNFRYAASQVGVAQAEADKGLERLNTTLSKAASGSKTAQKALLAVGVTLEDVRNKSKTEIFGEIADQMLKQGGAAKNAAAGNAIFGESFSKLVPLLDQGSHGINELAAANERLGGVLTDAQIQKFDEAAQKLDDIRRVLAVQISGVVADNAASIVSLSQALADLTSSIINFLGSNPQAALAIIGALAGGRVGGLPGAALGGIGGFALGGDLQAKANQRKLQGGTALLRHQFIKEAEVLKQLRASGQPFGDQQAKVRRLRDRFIASGGAIPGQGGGMGTLPQFLAGNPPKGRTGRTRKGPRDRSDDVRFQFEAEMRRAQMDTLRAQQSLATNSEDRAALALQMLDLQREEQEAELQNRVRRAERDFAEGKIDAQTLEQVKAQAESLRAEYAKTDALERQAIAEDLAARKAEDAAELVQSSYDLRLELLQNEAGLAETAAQRRDVELRILALMKEQEKARLEAVIADKQSSELAKAQAQQRLDELNNIYAGRQANVIKDTRGPLEQARADFSDLTEEMENLKVQGIMGVADALTTLATEGFGSFKEAAISAIQQVIAEFIRLQTIKFLFNMLGSAAGVPGGGFSLGSGVLPGAMSFSGNVLKPGFASGGFTGWGPRHKVAGFVHGREGVLNSLGMRTLGIPNLDALNRGAPLSTVSNDNSSSGSPAIPPFIFNNYAKMSAAEARKTGMQAAAGWRQQMAEANRKGY